MAVQNAWQLYKNNRGDYDLLHFRRYVATSLLESYKKNVERKDTRTSQKFRDCARLDGQNHMIKYKDTQSRCMKCHKKANFICTKCNVTLHPKNCFEQYHIAE
jgi:hypothetical protein